MNKKHVFQLEKIPHHAVHIDLTVNQSQDFNHYVHRSHYSFFKSLSLSEALRDVRSTTTTTKLVGLIKYMNPCFTQHSNGNSNRSNDEKRSKVGTLFKFIDLEVDRTKTPND